MPKTILCAVDLSPVAEEAIRQAAAQAASEDAALIVYHAFAIPPLVAGTMPEVLPLELDLVGETKRSAELFLEKTVARVLGRVTVRIEVDGAVGPAPAAILAKAAAVGASCVVVGSGAVTAFERWLLGAAAEKVVRHARCPVLVARPSPAGAAVLAATDLSQASFAAVRAGAAEAQRRRVDLVVVHCLDLGAETTFLGTAVVPLPPEDPESRPVLRRRARQRIEAWLAEARVTAAVMIEDGPPVAEIVRVAEALPAGLVVVGATGKTRLERLLLGSVAEGITRKGHCSVLAVRLDHVAARQVELDTGDIEQEERKRLAAAEDHQERAGKGLPLGKL